MYEAKTIEVDELFVRSGFGTHALASEKVNAIQFTNKATMAYSRYKKSVELGRILSMAEYEGILTGTVTNQPKAIEDVSAVEEMSRLDAKAKAYGGIIPLLKLQLEQKGFVFLPDPVKDGEYFFIRHQGARKTYSGTSYESEELCILTAVSAFLSWSK